MPRRQRSRDGLAAVLITALLSGCPGAPSYPEHVVEPEVVGIIEASTKITDEDGGWVASVGGTEVLLNSHQDRVLQRAAEGDLLLFGTQPERWFLGADRDADGDCHLIRAIKGYDEPGSVVVLYSSWPSVGIRLSKAPGFDGEGQAVHDPSGRPQYDGPSGVTFCADEQGRLEGLH